MSNNFYIRMAPSADDLVAEQMRAVMDSSSTTTPSCSTQWLPQQQTIPEIHALVFSFAHTLQSHQPLGLAVDRV